MAEEHGVWRTISGRRVFIKDGQSLTDAMRESGKFGDKSKTKKAESLKFIKPRKYPGSLTTSMLAMKM